MPRCKTCQVSAAFHELIDGQCHKCTANELEALKRPIHDAKYGKRFLAESSEIKHPTATEKCAIWIEWGKYYIAPKVDPTKFGGHAYDNGGYELGIRGCSCGCSMGSSSSSGPCDPFGACPENPLEPNGPKKPITKEDVSQFVEDLRKLHSP